MSSTNEDKKDIESEEREKKMNEENKAHDKISTAEHEDPSTERDKESEAFGKLKIDNIKEVKPKKIPTGGILMPGFFARSKSKEKCKEGEEDQAEEENTELVDKDESLMSQARIKLPNPFRKSKLINDEDGDKSGEPREKKGLLGSIRLPIVSVYPKKKKDNEQSLENQTKAGLASMETLDDTDKSNDKNDEMKNVPLDDKKDVEKQDIEETTCHQKIKAYRLAISTLLVFILILIIIIANILPTGKYSHSANVRDEKYIKAATSCGNVEGLLDDGAVAFRGIPYARPPLGDLRFRPAQPLNNLDYCWNGTLNVHNATETCLQIYSNGTTTGTEDCLTLDVVTPYVRYDSPLPVIVLIGAESLLGGSPGKMRPSARYARSRDVVFVRPNFRMGVLGFLALDILSKDAYPHTSGNYALSDIIEALKWVQYNIQHFGGDPAAVTLFGHQAGATLVTALTTTPLAEKLFSRAWATSSSALFPSKLLTESETDNQRFLSSVNCKDVQCLREMDAETLMNAVEDVWRKPQPDLPSPSEIPEKRHEWLVLDGKILLEHPSTVWSQQKGLPVKLVLGTTAHSAASEKLLMKHKEWSEDLVAHHIRKSALKKLNLSQEVLEMYPRNYKGLSQLISDVRTVCPLQAISNEMHRNNASFYVVTQFRGEQNISDVDSDVDAILGRYEPKTPEQRRYVSAIQQLFYHFIWHGKVQSDFVNSKVLIIGQDVAPAQNYSHCDFWIKKNVLNYAHLD